MSEFGFTPEQVLCRSSQLHGEPVTETVIPNALVHVVLRLLHDVPLAAHPESDKTLQNARKQYYWLNLRFDVKKHVLECELKTKVTFFLQLQCLTILLLQLLWMSLP